METERRRHVPARVGGAPVTLRQNLFSATLACITVVGGYQLVHWWRAPATIEGLASIVDGDTLDIGRHRIRIYGIDAPEMGQSCASPNGTAWACGHEAKIYLDKLIANRIVSCVAKDHDVYGRTIGLCKVASIDVGREMVRQGMAVAYKRYSHKYDMEETHAINGKRGMWAGTFQPPESWRRDHNDWQGR